MKSLREQIACVKREIAIRERVYPKWIESKRITADQCRNEIECMKAVLDTLQKLPDPQAQLFPTSADPSQKEVAAG